MLADLEWTEEQWEEYANKKVEITLETMGRLLTACELLRDGRRLKPNERKAWGALIKETSPVYLNLVARISQKGARYIVEENIFEVGDTVAIGSTYFTGEVISIDGLNVTVRWWDDVIITYSYTVLRLVEGV